MSFWRVQKFGLESKNNVSGSTQLSLAETSFLNTAIKAGELELRSIVPRVRRISDRSAALSKFCQSLLCPENLTEETLQSYSARLDKLERIYTASLVYALSQPARRRRNLAMYFTPPKLSEYVLDRIEAFGANFATQSFLDPAAGGASFIGPIAQRQLDRGSLPPAAAANLCGIEIDSALAQFARTAASLVLGLDAGSSVVTADALKYKFERKFDCIVGNPPYRVLTPSQRTKINSHAKPIMGAYANLYGLFILRGLEQLRDGGLMALIVPTSFLAGTYFGRLRAHISTVAEVLAIDKISRRKEFFRDVSHDVCLFVCRKKVRTKAHTAQIGLLGENLVRTSIGVCEVSPGSRLAWTIRSKHSERSLDATLADYGYDVSCGPVVHNRDDDLIHGQRRKRQKAVPLVWGHAIKHGRSVQPASRRSSGATGLVTFVSTARNTPPIQEPSIVLQRTTSADQARRIRAGFVDQAWLTKYGGFYGENHVVVVSPSVGESPQIDLNSLFLLMESAAFDRRLRQVLSSNSVNVTALRNLKLPSVQAFQFALQKIKRGVDIDAALEEAFRNGA